MSIGSERTASQNIRCKRSIVHGKEGMYGNLSRYNCTAIEKNKGTGNQFIGQYLSVHKDSFSNLPTNRRLEEAAVVDRPKMMKFKAS
ncbi:hypothetical protein AVEN_122993-1 [Araneus ventricosus]|uniref:Uncharacterized protein n=1 Tax=Araneus ventricosus TaxID=182803 RepID=A0A4Y2CVE0_ARAVE|nr:hypothetical protein AVEN_122993-1 [Araneus ventricosus]